MFADLAVCFTFLDDAETEIGLGDRTAAVQALHRGETGCAAIEHLSRRVERAGTHPELQGKIEALRVSLADFRRKLEQQDAYPPAAPLLKNET
ncbi:MAG TPA: hypothetical protein VMZ52_20795 [Bryobacteraceae bacterium]|nr:hypothetical protein [Bryobacteraceae bacterium]